MLGDMAWHGFFQVLHIFIDARKRSQVLSWVVYVKLTLIVGASIVCKYGL